MKKILVLGILLYNSCFSQTTYTKYFVDSLTSHVVSFNHCLLIDSTDYLLVGQNSIAAVSSTVDNVHWANYYYSITGSFGDIYPMISNVIALPNNEYMLSIVYDSSGRFGYMKIDSTGNILFTNTLDGFKRTVSRRNRDMIGMNGSLYFGGSDTANQNATIIKTDFNGNIIWSKLFPGPISGSSQIEGFDVDSSENIYLILVDLPTNTKIIVKCDSSGQFIWNKSFSYSYLFHEIRVDPYRKNNIYFNADEVFYNLDTSGIFRYWHNYQNSDNGYDLFPLKNNLIFLVHNFTPVMYLYDSYMLLDTNGVPLWNNVFGDPNFPNNYYLKGADISEFPDGYVFIGSEIVKTDLQLNSNCIITPVPFLDTTNYFDIDTSYMINIIPGTLIASNFNSSIVVSHQQLTIMDVCTNVFIKENVSSDINMYPNPFDNYFKIENPEHKHIYVKISDSLGKILFNYSVTADEIINTSAFSSGIYLVQLISQDGTSTKKIMKL